MLMILSGHRSHVVHPAGDPVPVSGRSPPPPPGTTSLPPALLAAAPHGLGQRGRSPRGLIGSRAVREMPSGAAAKLDG